MILKLIWVNIVLIMNRGIVISRWLCSVFCFMLKYLVKIRWFEWNVVLFEVIGRIIMLRKVIILLNIFSRLKEVL